LIFKWKCNNIPSERVNMLNGKMNVVNNFNSHF
jgi:hypothetical protein